MPMFQSVAKIELSMPPGIARKYLAAEILRRNPAKGGPVQTTIKSPVSFKGVGLHSGETVQVTIRPASAEYGIWFRRSDIELGDTLIPARWDAVTPAKLCTRLTNRAGVSVSTVEHIMAAIAGCGIQNALIEVDGPEIPILDGSSAQFVQGIVSRGIRTLDAPVRAIRILKEVAVTDGEASARLLPSDAFEIDFRIDFDDSAIGQQHKRLDMANGAFVRELCASRTFCRQSDIQAMQADGLVRGGSLYNAIVVDGDAILSPGGLRYKDEAVRHKMLDALGDLALAGSPLFGRYVGHRAGHALTNRLLCALFARPDAYSTVLCDEKAARRLPGVGVLVSDIPAVA